MRTLTVTLPDDMVETIEARVAASEYASASDVVRDGLESFLAEDPELEGWLRGEVVARRMKRTTDPALLISAEEVLGRIQRRFAARSR